MIKPSSKPADDPDEIAALQNFLTTRSRNMGKQDAKLLDALEKIAGHLDRLSKKDQPVKVSVAAPPAAVNNYTPPDVHVNVPAAVHNYTPPAVKVDIPPIEIPNREQIKSWRIEVERDRMGRPSAYVIKATK